TDQLDGFMLFLGNNSDSWQSGHQCTRNDPLGSTPKTKYVFKPNNVTARFISLKRRGQILTICEVTVQE
ncbi:hypothetical protein ACJMK2_032045, partial [Sinanodonta woodiana]